MGSLALSAAAAPVGYNLVDLGTLGGFLSSARSINSFGDLAGSSNTLDDAGRNAYRFSGGAMTGMGTLGGTNSDAYGINSSGQVVGDAWLAGDEVWHAFRSSGSSLVDLGTLGGDYSRAYGINSSGNVAGYSINSSFEEHAFMYPDRRCPISARSADPPATPAD